MSLEDVGKKIEYADYLLSRGDKSYFSGVVKHLLQAANLCAAELFSLRNSTGVNPALISKELQSTEGGRKFAEDYLALWKATTREMSKEDIVKFLNFTREFYYYVREKVI
jgi:hypothetical protein